MSLQKKIISMLTTLLFFFFPLYVVAQDNSVVDEANLFHQDQKTQMQNEIDRINTRFHGELFIYTTDQGISDIESFADSYLADRIGYNQNGAVLVIDMGERNFHISTSGNMIDYVTDARLEDMLDIVQENMANGDYGDAGLAYLSNVDHFITDGIPNRHYRIDRDTGRIIFLRSITTVEAIISFTLAIIASASFFFVIKAKYQLKSSSYSYPFKEKSSLSLTEKEDQLINSFITTRRIPRNTNSGGGGGGSTTHSSGGGSFGGGGRGF